MDYNDFAESIKQKYPQYKDVDNKTLASKVVEKYPVYRDRVEFESTASPLLDILKTAGKISETALPAAELAKGIPTPLSTKEARGVGQGAIQGATLGYGMPALRAIIPKSGQVPAPTMKESIVGNVLGGVGTSMLGVGFLPKITREAAKVGSLKKALTGGAIGAAYNPSETTIEAAPMQRAIQAIGGTLTTGAVSKIASSIENSSSKNVLKIWKEAKDSVYKSNIDKIEQYGSRLKQAVSNNPKTLVNLSDISNELKINKAAGILDPKVKLAVEKIPKLKQLIDNPETNINALEAQDLVNKINNFFPVNKLTGKTSYRPIDLPLKNLSSEIKKQMISAYPDELTGIGKDYHAFKDAYRSIKSKVHSENFFKGLEDNFNNPITKSYMDKILSKDVINDLGGYRSAVKALKYARNIAIAAGTGAIGGAAFGLVKKVIK